MKSLYVTFTDNEFKRLEKARDLSRGYSSWEKFILAKCCKDLPRVRGGKK